jgi:hypothetical protein
MMDLTTPRGILWFDMTTGVTAAILLELVVLAILLDGRTTWHARTARRARRLVRSLDRPPRYRGVHRRPWTLLGAPPGAAERAQLAAEQLPTVGNWRRPLELTGGVDDDAKA